MFSSTSIFNTPMVAPMMVTPMADPPVIETDNTPPAILPPVPPQVPDQVPERRPNARLSVIQTESPEPVDTVWLGALAMDDHYRKVYCKYFDPEHNHIVGGAVVSIPYTHFARIDGLYAVNNTIMGDFIHELVEMFKTGLREIPRQHIQTLNPKMSIKKQPGMECLLNMGFVEGEGLFGDEGQWYIYNVANNSK